MTDNLTTLERKFELESARRIVGELAALIRPVSKGGCTELNNLQLLCEDCDTRKGVQIIDYREG